MKAKMKSAAPKKGALRVWHIPQVPGAAFRVSVRSLDEAKCVLRTLADYDLFQFEQRVKPDYCNAQGLEVFEDGEWSEWCSEDGEDICEVMRSEDT